MGRCGLCGKLLDGNNVVMYPVNVGSSNIDVIDVGGGTFYAGNTSQTRNVPCCIKCVEKERMIATKNGWSFVAFILVLALTSSMFFFLAYFFI